MPQNLQLVVPAGLVSGLSVLGRDRFVTSSSMPSVNPFFDVFSNTAMMSAGYVSFEPSP